MSRQQTARTIARATALATTAVLGLGGLSAPAFADPGKGRGEGRPASAPGQTKAPQGESSKGRPANAGEEKGQGSQSAAPPAHSAAGGQGKGRDRGQDQEQSAPAGQSGKAPVKESPVKGKGNPNAGSPPGNNGTVKIAPYGAVDSIPNNSPHPGCSFQVEWYGFDEGADVISTVSFAMQAPTSDVSLSVAGDTSVFVGGSPAGGAGNGGLDGVETYALSFDGEPHPKQGYHVKLTVSTPRSNGNDTKSKVFWVEECGPYASDVDETPSAETPSVEGDAEGGTSEGGASDGGAVGVGSSEGGATSAGMTGGGQAAGTEVAGAQATAPDASSSTAEASGGQALGSARATAAVPTAVDAGLSEQTWTRSVLPLGVVALGVVLALAALVRRRGDQA
ncbi:hypothetical protein [Nocardioides pacificus]